MRKKHFNKTSGFGLAASLIILFCLAAALCSHAQVGNMQFDRATGKIVTPVDWAPANAEEIVEVVRLTLNIPENIAEAFDLSSYLTRDEANSTFAKLTQMAAEPQPGLVKISSNELVNYPISPFANPVVFPIAKDGDGRIVAVIHGATTPFDAPIPAVWTGQQLTDNLARIDHDHDGVYVRLSSRGAANGVPTLDASALVPSSQLPLATSTTYGSVRFREGVP